MAITGAPSSNLVETLPFYRRATNYIAAAMIYLQGNHMLEEPLKPEHIKHRLLGHWGTVPGLNLMYAGLNRLILDTQASILLVTHDASVAARADRIVEMLDGRPAPSAAPATSGAPVLARG